MAPNTPTFDRPPDIPLPAVTDDAGYLLKWFWVIKLGLFVHMDDPKKMQLAEKAFNEAYADIPLPTVAGGGGRNRRQVRMTPSQFIREHNRDTRVVTYMDSVGSALDPANGGGTRDLVWRDPATGLKILNIFPRPPSPPADIQADPEGLELLLDSLLYVCDGDEDIRLHLLRWITNLVFRPWQRMHHGILMTGEMGTGKSTVASILRVLLGAEAIGEPRPADLNNERFNSFLLNTRLCVVEEVMEQGNYTLYNRLKTIFTNDRIIIEEKMKPTFEVENISNLLLFSNHRYALNIEDGDRRLFTIWSNATAEDAKQKKADGYFIRLREWLGLDAPRRTYEGIWLFRKYLEENILPDLPEDFHVSQPPATMSKDDLIEASKHPLQVWLEDRFYEGDTFFKPQTYFKAGSLAEVMYADNYLQPFLKNRTLVQQHLRAFGYTQKRFQIENRKEVWAWFDKDGWGAEFEKLLEDHSRAGRAKVISYLNDAEFGGPRLLDSNVYNEVRDPSWEEDLTNSGSSYQNTKSDEWYEEQSNDAPAPPSDDEPF